MDFNDGEHDYIYISDDDDNDSDVVVLTSPSSSETPCYDSDDNYDSIVISEVETPYNVLNETQIKHLQDEQISHVTSVISVSRAEASILLSHYKWDYSRLFDQWFADESVVREKVNLISISKEQFNCQNQIKTCGICFDDDFEADQIRSVGCGHFYCVTCWRSYISTAINDSGAGCLSLRCPEPKCVAVVGQEIISELVPREEKQKYFDYLVKSYVECRKDSTKWCPAPDCGHAIEFKRGSIGSNVVYDVTCLCSYDFCWNCSEEPHRPVDCKIVHEWTMKNNSEAENTKWILAYSKPCPKCKRPIEKNHGCNHMTCGQPCGHQFCWICMGNWIGHKACNRYEARKTNYEKKQRKMAKESLVRYAHYYERWASNHKSRQKAINDLHKLQKGALPELCDRVKTPMTQLQFIVDAWKQIVECRRVLKWTYAYGYFLLEDEDAKKQLFEYLQGEAEVGLERLHRCAELELSKDFLGDDEPKADFNKFQMKLAGLTKVTGNYFENLVTALENGLSEVAPQKGSKGASRAPSEGTSQQPSVRVKGQKRKRIDIVGRRF